jgi:hypothetical protein
MMGELQMTDFRAHLLEGDGQPIDVLLQPAGDETKQEVENDEEKENDDAQDEEEEEKEEEEEEEDIEDGLTTTGELPAVPCLANFFCFCLSDDDIRCCLKPEKAPFWALSALISGFAALNASFYENHLAVYVGSGCAVISTIASLVLFLVSANRLGKLETNVTTLQTTVRDGFLDVKQDIADVKKDFSDVKKDTTRIMQALRRITHDDV